MTTRAFAIVLAASCASTPAPAPVPASGRASTPSWRVPDGWKHETIPFPLDFAPSLAHRGTARRTSCGGGSLWTFVLAPSGSPVRAELDALAAEARCDQPAKK